MRKGNSPEDKHSWAYPSQKITTQFNCNCLIHLSYAALRCPSVLDSYWICVQKISTHKNIDVPAGVGAPPLNIQVLTYVHTYTGRCIPRPISCSLTSASTVSHHVVACVTTVGGCLSKCCSRSVSNLAIDWISQTATVHNCQKYITSCKHMLLHTWTRITNLMCHIEHRTNVLCFCVHVHIEEWDLPTHGVQ